MKGLLIVLAAMVLCLWQHDALAFWGAESADGASGLDVASGFDINTITTVTGTVSSAPERKGTGQHTVLTVSAPQGAVTVVLGPWWYWEKQGFAVTRNQELTVTGSQAQGKDGALYLFAQKIENRSSSESITLRTESGKPLWSRGGASNPSGDRPRDGSGHRPGAGGRGFGMRGGRR